VAERVRRDLKNHEKFMELGEVDKTTRYSTKKVIEAERLLIRCADMLHENEFQPLDSDLVESIIAKPHYAGRNEKPLLLSDEQAKALRYLTSDPGRIKNINGLAGTGKTTLLSAMEEAYRRQGYTVLGCSVAGVAAQGLQTGAGIDSETVAMTLKQLYPTLADTFKNHADNMCRAFCKKRTYGLNRLKIDRSSVMVVDEAGMLGTEDYSKIALKVLEGGGILICVGDHRQLPSIGAGGGFEYIAKRVGQVDLQDIGRQSNHFERELIKGLSGGNAEVVIKSFAESGQLKISATQDKTAERLIADWKRSGGVEQPKDHVIVVSTNREVTRYNDLAQQELLGAGKLDMKHRVQVRDEVMYPGDRVIFTEMSRKLGVENGDRGVLVEVKDWKVGVTVAIRLDRSGETVQIPLHLVMGRSFQGFQRGYAFTTHKLQGATVKHSYVHVGGRMTNREMVYVQCSRHQETLCLYTEKLEAGKELTQIARQYEKQELKRQLKEQRMERQRQVLNQEHFEAQEQRQELSSEKLTPVEQKQEAEPLRHEMPSLHEKHGQNKIESREISTEKMRERVLRPAHNINDKTLEQPRQEEKVPHSPTLEKPLKVEQEVKHEADRKPSLDRREDFYAVADLSRIKLPEIGMKDYLDILASNQKLRQAELDRARKQEAQAASGTVLEKQPAIERSPSREESQQLGAKRQAEVGRNQAPEPKISLDRSENILPKVERQPPAISPPSVGQETKREPGQKPALEHRQENFAFADLSRVKLPEIELTNYLKIHESFRRAEIDYAHKQPAKASQDAALEHQAAVAREPSREQSPVQNQERKPVLLQASRQAPKVDQRLSLADIRRVEREHKAETLQNAKQAAPPKQELLPEKLQGLGRKPEQVPSQTLNQEKRQEQKTLKEKLQQYYAEKKQELPPTLKPEQKQTPKREKIISPLIKQMTESKAKKLAHEVMAEALKQRLERQEQEQSQRNSLGR